MTFDTDPTDEQIENEQIEKDIEVQEEAQFEKEAALNLETEIKWVKCRRKDLDYVLQIVKDGSDCNSSVPPSKERSLTITKIQEAIMWLGMELKRLGNENPYPNSYKPENAIVDPTADNLEL